MQAEIEMIIKFGSMLELDHAVLENRIQETRKTSLAYKESSYQDAHKQRRIRLLGNKGKDRTANTKKPLAVNQGLSWSLRDLNPEPAGYESAALTN